MMIIKTLTSISSSFRLISLCKDATRIDINQIPTKTARIINNILIPVVGI
jgi:hypothetical protein